MRPVEFDRCRCGEPPAHVPLQRAPSPVALELWEMAQKAGQYPTAIAVPKTPTLHRPFQHVSPLIPLLSAPIPTNCHSILNSPEPPHVGSNTPCRSSAARLDCKQVQVAPSSESWWGPRRVAPARHRVLNERVELAGSESSAGLTAGFRHLRSPSEVVAHGSICAMHVGGEDHCGYA